MTGWLGKAHGSFGSRNGQPWSQKLATANHRAEPELDRSAGMANRLAPPSPQALQEYIASQTCPWCGAGPYKSLGGHTNKAHGVSASELREMAGLKRVCSPELSEQSKINLERRPDFHDMSLKGNAASMALPRTDKQRTASKLSGSLERAAAAARVKYEQRLPAFDAEVLRRYHAGDLVAEISEAMGVALPTVKHSLTRSGVAQDLRGRAKQIDPVDPARMKEAALAATAKRTQNKIDRFSALGGDWAALCRLSEEVGQSRKSLRDLLKKNGIILDGRSAKPYVYRPRPELRKDPVQCKEADCPGIARRRGMCDKHYQRWQKTL